ncbi:hypothetical protein BY458DRAFT_498292 [Sporodiniella umbellata]|nr:hypothetical protein BY458DRAFT_498292 [Sporodiniella umbellata]
MGPSIHHDSHLYTDTVYQNRALFMTARLKQALNERQNDSFWRLITHRLYTLNYIFSFFDKYTTEYIPGQTEADFAVKYTLERKKRRTTLLEDAFALERGIISVNDHLLEQAETVFKQCLDLEAKFEQNKRNSMYIFYITQAGLLNLFSPRVECEDSVLSSALRKAVLKNKACLTHDYTNPFEDEGFVVNEEDDALLFKDWDRVEAV